MQILKNYFAAPNINSLFTFKEDNYNCKGKLKILEVFMVVTNIILLGLLILALANGVNIATHTLFDKPHEKS